MERENEMIVISQLLFWMEMGISPGRWLLPVISAILNASHCNSSHENRDKKEVLYGIHLHIF